MKEVCPLENETLTHSQAIKRSLLNNIWYLVLLFLACYMIMFLAYYAKVQFLFFGKAAVAAIVPTLIIGLGILIVWAVAVWINNARKQKQLE